MNVLIIEDDQRSARFLAKAFSAAGHSADLAHDGETGLQLANGGSYDVLIVDRMLPRRDGLSVVEELRAAGKLTPVIILSALGEVDDRVMGLRAGGDDYLTKPFSFSELLARVEALNRRVASVAAVDTIYRVGDLELDRLHAGQVVTRTMLLENVWEYHFDPQTNVIDVHVSRLRSKIEKGFDGPMLHTVRGAGYMLKAPVQP
jgi:two-component system, OmpR family, response regulator